MGFVQERIELREGEGAAVDIKFESQPASDASGDRWTLGLQVVVEPESPRDLWIGTVPFENTIRFEGKETTWIPIRALPDEEPEPTETRTLRLQLDAQSSSGKVVELGTAELEVVIHDANTATVCSDVGITHTRPRRVTPPHYRRRCSRWGVFETKVVVEADRGTQLALERISSYGRIHGWGFSMVGSRVRHHLVLQWDNERSAGMRVGVCKGQGGGLTLACDQRACEVYAAGEPIPPPGSPLVCR